MTHKDAKHENKEHESNNKESKKTHKWMNPKARGCCAYAPTIVEHYANIFTHAVKIPILKHIFISFKMTLNAIEQMRLRKSTID